MSISVRYLQEHIKSNDYRPELKERYFMKLAEEVGELARAMRKNARPEGDIKGTIEEELWDVMYYAIAIANCYDIDLERIIPLKEALNNEKYNHSVAFGSDVKFGAQAKDK